MARHIAVAGKGGTGKTTFSALLIRYLIENKKGSILAVDADPNANLNEVLGVKVNTVISDILEATKNPKKIPEGMTKDMYVEYSLAQSLVETENFDLLTMGRPQGPGCYCYPNDLLRKHLETLSINYDYVVIDSEAGMEHISRRVIQKVSDLFIISDASVRGVRSARRIKELVNELDLKIPNLYLIITKATGNIEPLQDEINKIGLNFCGSIPYNEQIVDFDAHGKPLFDLPEENAVVRAAKNILANCKL